MRIGLIGRNSIEFAERLLQIWNKNDTAVLIDCDAPPLVTKQLLKEANVNRCFIDSCILDKIDISDPSSFDILEFSPTSTMPCLLPESIRGQFKPRYDETEAIVIYSSGTTGKRKGISLSHRAINNNADSIIDYMMPSNEDCLYINKKLTHCSSIIGELLVALKSNARLLFSSIVIPPRISFKYIADYFVSILCCNPTLIKLYADEVERNHFFPTSVRKVYTSGECISQKEIERARVLFGCPVYNVYGQSECGPRITAQRDNCCNANSVGKAIKNVEVKTTINGEILVKTNALFNGYINSSFIQDEWHETGDIGFFDENGELYITGRKDNMIVLNSHNIFPETVENVIVCNTFVEDCLVYVERGKLICDYVSNAQNETEIVKIIKPLLMPYEIPKIYRKVDVIQKNGSGKKKRNNWWSTSES